MRSLGAPLLDTSRAQSLGGAIRLTSSQNAPSRQWSSGARLCSDPMVQRRRLRERFCWCLAPTWMIKVDRVSRARTFSQRKPGYQSARSSNICNLQRSRSGSNEHLRWVMERDGSGQSIKRPSRCLVVTHGHHEASTGDGGNESPPMLVTLTPYRGDSDDT